MSSNVKNTQSTKADNFSKQIVQSRSIHPSSNKKLSAAPEANADLTAALLSRHCALIHRSLLLYFAGGMQINERLQMKITELYESRLATFNVALPHQLPT
jgi:hypothetical protein